MTEDRSRATRDGRGARDRGAATAEFAMVLPAFVLVLVLVCGAASIGLAQLQAYDGARGGAREAARGETERQVVHEARERAGEEAEVTVSRSGGYTTVEVELPVPETLHFITETVSAEATARTEDGR
ncbi:TadE family protein [Brevibacterium litoralis]|uniref:TadE family protein n=1 Tax=Brevibacterium litoralis TaxID=3138935 RepID=UPI0032F004F1